MLDLIRGLIRNIVDNARDPDTGEVAANSSQASGARTDFLCALPFIHFNVMPNGDAYPCCASPHALLDEDGAPLNIRTHLPRRDLEFKRSSRLRSQMLRGEKPYHCAGCYQVEDGGFDSARTYHNGMILSAPDVAAASSTGFRHLTREMLGEETGPPTFFDLRFDNVCNLKCVMCFA